VKLLTIPKAKFDDVAYLDARRLLTWQYERGVGNFRHWDLTADTSARLPDGQRWAIDPLLCPGGGQYLRRNGLWLEGDDLPPTRYNLSEFNPLQVRPSTWAIAFRPDGGAALFEEMVSRRGFFGTRFHLREGDGSLHTLLDAPRPYDGDACAAFSPDGRLAAMSGGGPVVVVWDLDARKAVGQLEQTDNARGLLFLAADRLAVAAGRTVRIWDVPEGRLVLKLPTFRKYARALAVSPDHRLLAVGSADGQVGVWQAATGKAVSLFDWKVGAVGGVAFSPDGSTAAAAGEKGVVLWDVD
jgi:hypothetical protein